MRTILEHSRSQCVTCVIFPSRKESASEDELCGSVVRAAIAILAAIILHARGRHALFLGTARGAPTILEVAVFAITTCGVACLEWQSRCLAAEIALTLARLCGGARRGWSDDRDRAPAASRVSSHGGCCAFGVKFVRYHATSFLA